MKKLNFSLILLMLGVAVYSQNGGYKTTLFWVDGQVGVFSSVKDMGGFSRGVSLNAVNANNLYKVRYFFDERFELFEPIEKYNEMSLLMGKSIYSRLFQINLSAGIGITYGEILGNTIVTEYTDQWYNRRTITTYEFEKFTTPSIPIEIDLMIKPLKVIGLGISFGSNLNLVRPTFRSTLSFNVGKLR